MSFKDMCMNSLTMRRKIDRSQMLLFLSRRETGLVTGKQPGCTPVFWLLDTPSARKSPGTRGMLQLRATARIPREIKQRTFHCQHYESTKEAHVKSLN